MPWRLCLVFKLLQSARLGDCLLVFPAVVGNYWRWLVVVKTQKSPKNLAVEYVWDVSEGVQVSLEVSAPLSDVGAPASDHMHGLLKRERRFPPEPRKQVLQDSVHLDKCLVSSEHHVASIGGIHPKLVLDKRFTMLVVVDQCICDLDARWLIIRIRLGFLLPASARLVLFVLDFLQSIFRIPQSF